MPAWRAILSLKEGFENLTVPCPGGPTGCTLRLGDIHVNSAELLLRPAGSPPGFSVEDSIAVEARPLLRSDNVPLARSPVGEVIGAFRVKVPPPRFRDTDPGPDVPLPVSSLIKAILTDTTTATSPTRPARYIALMTSPEAFSFGFAAFKAGPRLRLVLTASTEQR